MTIEKARKILGKTADTLSDVDIQAIIDNFCMIIEVGLRQFERKYKVKAIIDKSDEAGSKNVIMKL